MSDIVISNPKNSKIMELIQNFGASFDDEHVVGIEFAPFGSGDVLKDATIEELVDGLLIFSGVFNGEPTKFVQHISQLNFRLIKTDKEDFVVQVINT